MCGRYALVDIDPLEEYGHLPDGYKFTPNDNVAPSQTNLIITGDGVQLMRWGLIPKWAKDGKIGYKLINARSETLFEKPMWKGIVTRNRCLIPANGFYEWQKREDGKQPFYIHPKDQELFMFAGLWETWKHEGKEWNTYTIITTSPNKEMTSIHDRMPVILHKDDRQQWLEADRVEDISPLLVPYPDNSLEMSEYSKDINIVKTKKDNFETPKNSK